MIALHSNEQLQNEIENSNDKINLFEEMYFSTLDNISIIGNQEELVDATIFLLNNDISKFNAILKKFGLDSPFKVPTTVDEIVDFIDRYDVAKGFDKDEIKALVMKPGKQGKKAIRLTLEEISLKIKETSIRSNDQTSYKKRGDHVINNGVLKVYQDIIDNFTLTQFKKSFQDLTFISQNELIRNDYDNTFPINVKNNIQNVLIVHLNENRFDANALYYGIVILMLHERSKNYMVQLYKNINSTPKTQRIKLIIKTMNDNEIYVDHVALKAWQSNRGNMKIYQESLAKVRDMFDNLCSNLQFKLNAWTKEIYKCDPHC
ncbi:unnamed protein product [Adineta steineri]|uniref:Uncharacterized protein n=1 Tax=Adineta steineri TaxID=433720 RepID=A0A819SVR9_9BILA|nr:unnamed protein product [Adineta steineri]CAF4057193.1 unnamed protein product [Adineta steineri]